MMKRRDFLLTTGIAGLGIGVFPAAATKTTPIKQSLHDTWNAQGFVLPELGYAYDALEPYIDAQTMEIHYSRHHAGYVNKLNAALENHPLKGKDLDGIMKAITADPKDTGVLNNGGGHYNHTLFWEIMTPGGSNKAKGSLARAIDRQFGSRDAFLEQFSKAAATVFGSGWAWLAINENKELFVTATRNQENPAMVRVVAQPGTPILGIDVWEHAYYLKYQNRRKDYIANFINTINWDVVGANFDATL
jgi:Fe-Mn family superoxide dismutase